MLFMIRTLSELSYSQIMKVYEESNIRYGCRAYPRSSRKLQLLAAEQDFYAYLRDFFSTDGAIYAVWTVAGEYKSALRLEPYEDGYLLAGLETVPDERGKGYAKALMCAVLTSFRKTCNFPVYSHVEKTNAASLAVHKACGFLCIREDADYIDGSHRTDAFTFIWKETVDC